ncbi:MAG: rhamnulokinase, partial [Christensenellales bacterium]
MKTYRFLGYDFGASSGRAMLGVYDGARIELSEIHRFSNDPVELNGRFVWDVQRLFFEMKQALLKVSREGIELDAIGIDTWGVDFGLLDKNGNLAGIPVHYRDKMTDGMMEKAFEVVSKEKIFEATGLAFNQFNTLFQLYAMKEAGEPALEIAEDLLFIPDLMAYFLTGVKGTEYTVASTSQMIDPVTRDWAGDMIDAFGIPRRILGEITPAGTLRGTLLPEIAKECGVGEIPVIAVAGHDTASAVAAVPASNERFAYLSSGTWSLLGAELDRPLTDKSVMEANYTNEGGICGTIRLLKNIMGLWIIQECKREWDRRGEVYGFDELVKMADQAPAFQAVLNVDDPAFLAPGDMPARVQEYCRKTGQRVPEGAGEISRVVYESLALMYRWGIEALERDMLKQKVEVLHIVGGGSKNEMLNVFTANAINRPVIAGPSEGTVIGNLLVQAMAVADIRDLKDLRRVVANSFPTQTYLPAG